MDLKTAGALWVMRFDAATQVRYTVVHLSSAAGTGNSETRRGVQRGTGGVLTRSLPAEPHPVHSKIQGEAIARDSEPRSQVPSTTEQSNKGKHEDREGKVGLVVTQELEMGH